ncbi:MAG: Druantia anti-phage system protein DruA [Hyphomicrobium sp.]
MRWPKRGIAVADITVCGAVQPYNAILGGKLVAMLAASPEIVLEYRRRYSRHDGREPPTIVQFRLE